MTLTGLGADLTWDTVSKEAEFERLMGLHERLVLRTALRLLGRVEDAQDASQDVFLRLYRNLDKVESETNIPGWLYRVTVNVCYDMGRKRNSEVIAWKMSLSRERAAKRRNARTDAAVADMMRLLSK